MTQVRCSVIRIAKPKAWKEASWSLVLSVIGLKQSLTCLASMEDRLYAVGPSRQKHMVCNFTPIIFAAVICAYFFFHAASLSAATATKHFSCPSTKPEEFFNVFAKNSSIQKTFTYMPLLYVHLTLSGAASKPIKIYKLEDLPFFSSFGERIAKYKGVAGAPNDLYFEFNDVFE